MDEKAKAILAAIKKDDLAAFKKLLDKETEKYAFGRFPLLSLCYLYNSRKIAFTYEKRLLAVSRYTPAGEDRESYLRFRERARRVLRLYVGGRTVSPLVMLALTGRQDALRALYPAAYKDAAIRSEIAYAENVLFGSETVFGQNSIKIRRKKMPLWQVLTASVSGAVALVMTVCCLLGFFFVPKDRGTAEDPVLIGNEKQLPFIMEREGYFALTSDVSVPAGSSESFKGVLDGKGNTLRFSAKEETALGSVTGTIKNAVIELDVGERQIDENTALFASTITGRLENVTFRIKGSFLINDKEKESETDDTTVYVSCLCGENKGVVDGCEVICDLAASNAATRNAYFAVIASENTGTVKNCVSDGTLRADTVDIAGMVAENRQGGTITECESKMNLTQTTEKTGWTPNVGGICLNNAGTISSCRFSGEIRGEVVASESEEKAAAYLGGICVNNEGVLSDCVSEGKIFGTSSADALYSGGVATFNYNEIDSCLYKGKQKVTVGTAYAAVGGIVALNTFKASGNYLVSVGKVKESTAEGKIETVAAENVTGTVSERHIGGVAGLCNGAAVDGCEVETEIVCKTGSSFVGGAVGVNMDERSVYYTGNKVGVFSTTSSAKITIENDSTAGGVAGYSAINVENSTSSCIIKGGNNAKIGGVVGVNRSLMRSCSAEATITCGDDCIAGGVAATSASTVIGCTSNVTITAGNNDTVGGLIGTSYYFITDCNVTCELIVGDDCVTGGLSGCSLYTGSTVFLSGYIVTGSTVKGSITAGKNGVAGGISGINGIYGETKNGEYKETTYGGSSINRCKAEMTATVGEGTVYGGAAGRNGGMVTESFFSGTVTARNSTCGGMIGKNEKGVVRNNFSAVKCEADGGIGSLFGQIDNDSATMTLTFKERFIENNRSELEKMDAAEAEKNIERYYSNNVYYYQNSYVKQDGVDAYGIIDGYDKATSSEAYAMEAIGYATEKEMKNSDKFKEVFGSETEQNNSDISGGTGGGSAL